jgi:hypothetical protein
MTCATGGDRGCRRADGPEFQGRCPSARRLSSTRNRCELPLGRACVRPISFRTSTARTCSTGLARRGRPIAAGSIARWSQHERAANPAVDPVTPLWCGVPRPVRSWLPRCDRYRPTDPKRACWKIALTHRRSRQRGRPTLPRRTASRAREDSVIGRLSPGGPYDPRPRSWPPGSGFHAQTSVEGCFQARTERLSR